MAHELLSGPPASGKKAYLKSKIKSSIKSGIRPEEILVLTNSINSARDLRNCIIEELNSCTELWVETVTSFCKKILRENYFLANLRPGFRVISDFEKRLIVRNILKRDLRLKFLGAAKSREGLIKEISNFIDISKRNPGWEKKAQYCAGQAKIKYDDLKLIITLYQQSLKKFNYLDFVDLTINTRNLLNENSKLMNFKALFVHEAEDMDFIMGDIITLILPVVEYAAVSLSAESCIYRFRGARPEYIEKKLMDNFNFKIIHFKSENRNLKEYILEAATRDEQAESVAKHIASKIKGGIHPKDIIIISRSMGEGLWIFTEALKRRGINYMLVGGIGFFRQSEIIEFMSLLNCIHAKKDIDEKHLCRTIRLMNILDDNQLDILRRNSMISGKPFLRVFKEEMKKEWKDFQKKIDVLREAAGVTGVDLFIYGLLKQFYLFKNAAHDVFISSLYGYFYKTVQDFSEYYKKLMKKPLSFNEFMDNLYDLLSGFGKELDIPYIPEEETVKIMTVQRSKGQVFSIAYIVDMTEDNFPRPFYENPLLSSADYNSLELKPVPGIKQQFEFEKRLFEVARTRGKEEVIYSWYNTDESNGPVYISGFIADKRLQYIGDDIANTIIDETDLFIKLIEEFDRDLRKDFILKVGTAELIRKMDHINSITEFKPESLIDRVVKGIPETFSFTVLENFRECPEKFFIKHILKIKEMPFPHMLLGTAVHRIMQRIHSPKAIPDAGIERIIKEVWTEMDFYSGFESRNLFLIGRTIIFNYLRYVKKEPFNVIATEEKFSLNFRGIQITGRFDRIDRLESGQEKIVDYKTGKVAKMEKGLLSAVEKGENFQIPIYRWARKCKYFSIYWLRKETGSMEAIIDFEQERSVVVLKKAEKYLIDTVETIRNGKFVPEGKNCRMCYFSRICSK